MGKPVRLYIMRHANAVSRGTAGYGQGRDSERPLNENGREQAHKVAKGLKRLGIIPDLLLTSPYRRATETAEQVRRVLGPSIPTKEMPELRSEARPAGTSLALGGYASAEEILLVGHEPHLSSWLAELVATPSGFKCLIKKAGVSCVEVPRVPPPGGSGVLRWLMTPKQLSGIAKAARHADEPAA